MEWLPEAPGSGVGRMYHGILKHLPEQGIKTSGLVTGSSRVSAGDAPVEAFANPNASLPRRLWNLRTTVRAHLRTQRPDVVASHFALYTLPYLDLLGNVPLVIHFHGPWARESEAEGASRLVTWIKKGIEQITYSRAHRFVVLSEAFQSILVDTYNIPADRIRIVPGGVDIERFASSRSSENARAHFGWPEDRPILLAVRRLVRRVGLEQLIDAMSDVRDEIPNALLLIAGKGPLADELRARIQRYDLEDHVRLLGFLPDEDLPLAYRAADVSVVPTQSLEGFGLVAAESLAAGTPPLVTPIGGLPEVVRDLSRDLIMEASSTRAIRNHLVAALNGSLALPSAEQCEAFASANYDWTVIAKQVQSVYESLL